MPAIARLLQRWGFVKISRYGLVLTPEDRIMSLRPAVLDDGLGGRVVGWQDGDLAAAELKRWESSLAPPSVLPELPRPLLLSPPARPTPAPAARPTPAPAARPMPVPAAEASAPAPAQAAAPALVSQMVGEVAPKPPVEEDDWEWEISLARARAAAADEAEDAARTMAARASVRPAPIEAPVRPTPAAPVRPAPAEVRSAAAPPVMAARPAQASSDVASRLRPVVGSRSAASSPRSEPPPRKTMPLGTTADAPRAASSVRPAWSSEQTATIEYSDYSQASAERARSPEAAAPPRPQAHPALVARATAPEASAAPSRRFARGTSPLTPKRGVAPAPARVRVQADEPTMTGLALPDRTATDLPLGDRTTPNLPLEDRTRPGLALPSIRGRLAR